MNHPWCPQPPMLQIQFERHIIRPTCPALIVGHHHTTTMTPLLAILETRDYALLAAIVIVGSLTAMIRSTVPARLRLDLRRLERKLDALLKHQGIELPSEVEFLAKDPNQKIAAVKLYREEHPGTSLREAVTKVEEIAKRDQ